MYRGLGSDADILILANIGFIPVLCGGIIIPPVLPLLSHNIHKGEDDKP
jgi:hypothetical protein